MITFTLEGQTEKVAPVNPFPTLARMPLYHQMRTYEALERFHLVVNTYNTGAGKTVASLLHLFRLNGKRKNVLFIAPTNALIGQHAADIRAFVVANDLEFEVVEVTAARLRQMDRGRSGETLYRLIQNPLTYYEALGLPASDYRRRPVILVVNPDIFYYALYFRYGSHDQRNIFQEMATAFPYVVIDEFHYYNSKQFANFLFFFLLSQQVGRFEEPIGQRICLLSATPTASVQGFLERAFGPEWSLISPGNEPPEADALPTVPTLSPLHVSVVGDELQEWARDARPALREALEGGQHGAIISSALWRINEAYQALRHSIGEQRLGRITGPEPEQARQSATARDLILATPTVDIGYNFRKHNKPRQNIDFVACDGRFVDEWIQRLGRAGRVLGKAITDQASRATLVLRPEHADRFLALDGRTLTRRDFAEWLSHDSGLPVKHDLAAYIRSHAIMESFYPLWKLRAIVGAENQSEIDMLYERICELFAPGKRLPQWKPSSFFRRYRERVDWLRETPAGTLPVNNRSAQMLADYVMWADPRPYEERITREQARPQLASVSQHLEMVQLLREFVEGQVALTESLFAFRDSFQGPVAAIHDPGCLLSSEMWNEYDLFHILANYEYELMDERAFRRLGGEGKGAGELYVKLRAFREPRLSMALQYTSKVDQRRWDESYCRQPIALKGMQVRAREQKGDPYPLPAAVTTLLEEKFVVALVVRPGDQGPMYGALRGSTLYPYRLEVRFPDGTDADDYYVLLGTAAWLAEAELRGHFRWQARKESDAIIL